MPIRSSRARMRWASKKRSFRRRWPVYLAIIILAVFTGALTAVILNDVYEPAQSTSGPSLPKAIR